MAKKSWDIIKDRLVQHGRVIRLELVGEES